MSTTAHPHPTFVECRDVYDAGDAVMNFVDRLPADGMSAAQVRARIYGFAMRLRPARLHADGIQSRADSFMEALTNTTIGFAVSLVTWIVTARAFGIPMTWGTNFAVVGIFTAVSIARQYILRRLFNGRSPWRALRSL